MVTFNGLNVSNLARISSLMTSEGCVYVYVCIQFCSEIPSLSYSLAPLSELFLFFIFQESKA